MKIDLKKICKNATNFSDDNYVGIKYYPDDIRVSFPIGYRIPDDYNECRKSIIELVNVINISKSILEEGVKKSKNIGDNDELPMNSFIWIINDYLKNGLYHDNEKTYIQSQSGKINWKKTLNSEFFISNKSIVYLNPYVQKTTLNDNIITDIHAFCINYSIKYIGWLFGNIQELDTNIQERNIQYYLSIINKELIHAFDDRKKTLLINIKKILENCGGNKFENLKNYGTYQFEYIWEYMTNKVFGNEKVEKFFPSSYWKIGNLPKFKDSSLRPDTILTVDKDIYIIDSKYYKFGITKNINHLPHTDSIQKQITYAEYIEKSDKFDYSTIYNAFILPYNKIDNKFDLNNNIEYVGFSFCNWKKNTEKIYEHISLIFIDTKYLIDCYLKYNTSKITSLISSIQEVLDTFDKRELN